MRRYVSPYFGSTDMSRFDWEKMRTLVVQRVIERGRKDDFFAILNRYGRGR